MMSLSSTSKQIIILNINIEASTAGHHHVCIIGETAISVAGAASSLRKFDISDIERCVVNRRPLPDLRRRESNRENAGTLLVRW